MNKISGSLNIKNIHSNRKIILISKIKKCTYIEKKKKCNKSLSKIPCENSYLLYEHVIVSLMIYKRIVDSSTEKLKANKLIQIVMYNNTINLYKDF